MTAFTGKRQEEDEKLKREIETVVNSLSKLNDTRLRFNVNNQVSLMFQSVWPVAFSCYLALLLYEYDRTCSSFILIK